MLNNAFFIDGNWCYGCHSCELACRAEHRFPEDQTGIKVIQVGVWDYEDGQGNEKWQHDYLALPTSQCDACEGLIDESERPLCEKVCPAQCIKLGTFAELAKSITTPKQILYRL